MALTAVTKTVEVASATRVVAGWMEWERLLNKRVIKWEDKRESRTHVDMSRYGVRVARRAVKGLPVGDERGLAQARVHLHVRRQRARARQRLPPRRLARALVRPEELAAVLCRPLHQPRRVGQPLEA